MAKVVSKIIWLAFISVALSACGDNPRDQNLANNQEQANSQTLTSHATTIISSPSNQVQTSQKTTDPQVSDVELASNKMLIDQITFTDAKLANCVWASALAKQWTTVNQMIELSCMNKGINSIGGIQNLTGLRHLDLSFNAITTLTPLSNLTTLTKLNLASNGLVNISPLANLVNLTYLNLGVVQKLSNVNNNIRDITALANLTALVTLDLSSNQISDVTPLANLNQLSQLYLPANQIRDINVLLNHVSAKRISLRDNDNITCAQLNELETTLIEGRIDRPSDCIFTLDILISDIHFTDPNLKRCILDTASSEGWITLNEMTRLNCDEQAIADLTGLQNFKALHALNLSNNPIVDISPLFNLTATTNIDLSLNSQIACVRLDALQAVLGTGVIAPPSNCAPLTLISDLDFVDPSLEACVRRTANIHHWRTINEMVSLNCNGHLNRSANTQIRDLRGIEQLTALTTLDLAGQLTSHNQNSDITALLSMTNLTNIFLSNNSTISCNDLDAIENSISGIFERPANCIP